MLHHLGDATIVRVVQEGQMIEFESVQIRAIQCVCSNANRCVDLRAIMNLLYATDDFDLEPLFGDRHLNHHSPA